jgi:hypothetical protein
MSAISKQLIDFTSEIIADNYSIELDDVRSKLSSKENKEKIANFIKSNKIKQKKEKTVSNEPEKFKTAYNLFSKEYRKIITKENPGVTISEAASLLGKKWEELKEKSPSVYQKYVDQSNKQKEEYEEKMIQYRIDNNLPEKITKVSKPKKNKAGIKKKAESAFHYFFHDHDTQVREDNPDMNKHAVYLYLRKRWNELKDEKDEIFLKYKEVAKVEKKKLLSQTSDDDEAEEAPSSPAPHSSPTPESSPEKPSTPVPSSPEEPSTPTPKKKMKKKSSTPPGALSESKYLTSPPVRSSIKKKKTKKVIKDDKAKDEKKKKKKKIVVIEESSESESDSDSESD